MRYHGPGWSLDLTIRDEYGDKSAPGALYQLWAPQDGAISDPHRYAEYQAPEWIPRTHWAASWQSANREDGDFVKGESAERVLQIFEAKVRAKFITALRVVGA